MCDLAYALLVEEMSARVESVAIGTTIAIAFGANVDLPSQSEFRADLDKALVADLPRQDRDRDALLRELGVL